MLRKSRVFHTPHRSDQFKTKTTDGRKTAIIGEPAQDLMRTSPLGSPKSKRKSNGSPTQKSQSFDFQRSETISSQQLDETEEVSSNSSDQSSSAGDDSLS